MLKRRGSLLITALIVLAMATAGGRSLLSVPPGGPSGPGGPGGPAGSRWLFTHPVDGSNVSGPAAFLGTGPSNAAAMLSIYTQDNTMPGGVYPSELTLKATRLVDTAYYDMWSSDPYGYAGLWFATIIPHNLSEGGGLPVLEVSVGDPTADLDSLATLSGGDAVSYRITD